MINFTDEVPTTSAEDCASQCFARHCVVAGYTPAFSGGKPMCMLAYSGESECGRSEKVSTYTNTTIAELRCIECGGVAHVIEATPISVTKGEVEATAGGNGTTAAVETSTPSGTTGGGTGGTTGTPGVSEVRHCVGNISFVVAGPGNAANLSEVAKITLVSSAKACAQECYAHGCTKAIFRPSSFHVSEIEASSSAPCVLSFDSVSDEQCSSGQRVGSANDQDSAAITCVECCKFF